MTPTSCTWPISPATLSLSSDEIHVWRARLDVNVICFRHLRNTLTEDELSRAERFYVREVREHYIVARGILRTILGRYLHTAPQQLCFSYNVYGKPALIATGDDETLRFSVSHSHGLALYAVTRDRAVGIDLEYIRAEVEPEAIASRFFTRRENEALRAYPAGLRRSAFFSGWTRKEAYLKARGDGLSLRLDHIEVSLAPNEPARLLNVTGDRSETSRWSLQALSPWPGYAAALAVEGHIGQLTCWEWQA